MIGRASNNGADKKVPVLNCVDLSVDEGEAVVMRLQDPMTNLEPGRFRPVCGK